MKKNSESLLTVNNNSKAGYIAVFLLAAALYIATCAPGPVWQDSGMIQYRVWHNDIEGKLGLALSHPLFYILAIGTKYIPIGEFAYRINLLSAIIAAVAVANLFLLLRLWLGKSFPALIGAASLALSHTFWRHAALPETYNLSVALLLCELIMLLQYAKTQKVCYLYFLAGANGLAIANHMLASIAFVCYFVLLIALLVKKHIKWQNCAVIVLVWIAGALPYEYLIVKNILHTGQFWSTLTSAAFGNSWQNSVLNTSLSARIIKENLILIVYNFPTPNILLMFMGLAGLYKNLTKRWFGHILIASLLLFFAFAFRYTVPDRYAFFIPFYCMVSVLIGVGLNSLLMRSRHKFWAYLVVFFTLLPIPAYIVTPIVAENVEFNIGSRSNIPYRNEYTYFLQPWRTGYTGAEKFTDEVFSAVDANAVVYATNTTVYPLLYAQEVKGDRPDIKIISQIASTTGAPTSKEKTIEQWLAEGTVYTVLPVEGYKLEKVGILWQIAD